jgi:hypothetical protein
MITFVVNLILKHTNHGIEIFQVDVYCPVRACHQKQAMYGQYTLEPPEEKVIKGVNGYYHDLSIYDRL